jgi:hypothetical protein
MAIGAAVFGAGSAVVYSATHPGGSWNQDEYLSTVWRWTLRGGVAGALAAGIVGAPALYGAKFGVTSGSLFFASATSGLANVIVTGFGQGGYSDLTQVEGAFMSGFYSTYAFVLAAGGIAAAFQVPRTAIWTRASIAGGVGVGFGYLRGETSRGEMVTNFATNFVFGLLSPSMSDTSKKLGYGIFKFRPPSNNPYIISSPRYLSEYVAEGIGYTVSTLSITAAKPAMQKLFFEMALKGWQYVTQ